MAKKITSQDIADADVFGPTRESASALLKVVKELEGELLDVSKILKGDLSKNPLASFDDTKKFTQDAEAAKTVLKQLEKVQVQRIALQTEEAKAIAKISVENQQRKKDLRDEAVLSSKSTSDLQKRRALLLQMSKLDAGSPAFIKAAREAGKLTDNINDARDAAKAFASESKSATAKTLFSQIGNDISNLDFKGAADKSKQFAAVISSISFKEVVAGITSFGTALANVGKALLLNPFTLLLASLAAVAFIIYDVVKAFSAMESATKAVDEAIKKTTDRIETLQKRYRDAAIDIKESTGFITKEAADAQRTQLRRQDEAAAAGLEIQKNFNEARKKLAEELNVDLEELEDGRADESYSGDIAQLKRNEAFNKEIVRLEKARNDEVLAFNKSFRATNQAEDFKAAGEKLEKDKQAKNKELKELAEANKKIQEEIRQHNKTLLELRRQFEDESLLLDSTNLERERGQASFRFLREIEALEEKLIKKKTLSEQEKQINEQIIKNVELLKDRLTQELDKLETELKPIEVKLEPLPEDDPGFNAEIQKKIDAEEKKRQQDKIDMIREITDVTLQEINKRNEARIKELDREIAAREKNIDRQSRLAEQGLDNTLAFEKQKQAEAEVERRRLAEQQERREKRIAYFKAFTAFLEENPNNAAAKALTQLVVAEAIAGFFKDGVENFQGKGTGTSDSNIVAISKGESITTSKATEKYPGLASAMNNLDIEKWVADKYSMPGILLGKNSSDPQMLMAIKQVTRAIEGKKETNIHWDGLERRIETTVKEGARRTITHIRRKPRL